MGEKEVRPTTTLIFAALLYFGLERGRRLPRTALQELFFPDADEQSGAHSLRQLLYRLKRLGAPLEADAAAVELPADQVHDDSAIESTNGHIDALERYGRGFLPGYAPKLSERYAEWLEERRAAVVSNILRQLIAALKASREGMNWPAVEKYAHRILELDAFNEEATLALAEATALTGAKAKALELLSRYESETGRTDLRLPPALLRRRISEAAAPRRNTATTRFVGRDVEAEALRRHILDARAGTPSLVVIAGEAGIGKTRLVEEAVALAELEGIRVHVVRCQPHYASRPLGVFIELVPSLLSAPGALGVQPESLQQLKLLTSHVESRDNTTQPEVLLASLRDLVDAVACETPTALVIEDAWRADPHSLAELRALAHPASKRKLVVLCTTRVTDPLKKAGAIDDDTLVLRLRPLASHPMHSMARELLPAFQSAQDVANWCADTAAGNPLFLQMLCRHHRETGQSYVVPPDLRSATTQRVEQLPQDCRRVLQFSALLGRHATLHALESLTECSPAQLLGAIERLEEEGYLRVEGEAPRVAHDLLSECTLGALTPLAKRMIHRSVAAHLESRYDASGDAALMWDCAEHWSQSGDVAKALELLKRCARHAAALGQHPAAEEILGRARQIARAPAEIADILGELMVVSRATYSWGVVQKLAGERSELLRDVPHDDGHTAVELAAATAAFMTCTNAEWGVSTLSRCAGAPNAGAQHRLDAASLLVVMAHESCDRASADAAMAAVEPCLEGAASNYRASLLALRYHVFFGDRDAGMEYALKLRASLPGIESISERCHAAHNLAGYLTILGPLSEALAVAEEYLAVARRLKLRAWIHELCCDVCLVHCMAEDWPTATEWYGRATESLPPGDRGRSSFGHVANGIELAVVKGDAALARTLLESMARYQQRGSLGVRAMLVGLETRIDQIDPRFTCDDAKWQVMREIYERAKAFGLTDGLTLAMAEEHRRRSGPAAARAFVADYVTNWRRQRWPVAPLLGQYLAPVAGH